MKLIRIAALNHEALGITRVKVIFKEGEWKESAYWMDGEVYRAIPLGIEATLGDYQKLGKVDEAQNTDIYSNL